MAFGLAYQRTGETLKVLKQTGKSKSIIRDAGRISKLAGKRISRNGKTYWETRINRSDKPYSNV